MDRRHGGQSRTHPHGTDARTALPALLRHLFFEWLWRLVQLHNWFAAYRAISFEREAYANGSDLGYLARRRHFAQWRKPLAEKR